jgi:hypothetical protein
MLKELFEDKALKSGDKTNAILKLINAKQISVADLLVFAENAKGPVKAMSIEAVEFVTQKDAHALDAIGFAFIVECLGDEAPRIKWECAKVIANTCHVHKTKLDKAIVNLLTNTEHEGTVVRWSSATALGKIALLKIKNQKELLKAMETIMEREEKNSIKKIYAEAIKKTS